MSLLDVLTQATGGDGLRQLSRQLGADEQTTAKAVAGALPMLIGALNRNASNSNGAEALSRALARDHDGSVLDNVQSHFRQGDTGIGDGILRHVLGGRRGGVEGGLARMSGLNGAQTGKMLAMLAPLVMGALGKQQRSRGLDVGGLAGMLQRNHDRCERRSPGSMGMVGKLLDADGDGDISDDVMKLGAGLLGGFLRRR